MPNQNFITEEKKRFIFHVTNELHLDKLSAEQEKRALVAREAATRSLIKNGPTSCIFSDFLSIISWHLVQDGTNDKQQH